MKRLFVILIALVLACKGEERKADSFAVVMPQATRAVSALPPPPAQPEAPEEQRMIIRNAAISLVVRDAAEVLRKASALVEGKGGYVANERQWKERDQVRASATLRVPSARLKEVLRDLAALGVRVESESISGDDVSQEFSDLGAQLRNMQAAETELRALLTTVRQRTQKAADIMEVFSELTRVRGEIERIQGRMQYLSQMTALSTITLELIPDAIAAPVVEPGWQPVATARAAMRSLLNTMKSAADVVIWIGLYILPIVAVFVAVVLAVRAVWIAIRRRRYV